MRMTITIGPSGAGKTTWAMEQWEKAPHSTILVNRDSLRYASGYTEDNVQDYYKRLDFHIFESTVSFLEKGLINCALSARKDVIVDATNLKLSYVKRLKEMAEKHRAAFFIKLFLTDIGTCLERNALRNRVVPEKIIHAQHERLDSLLTNQEFKALLTRHKNRD